LIFNYNFVESFFDRGNKAEKERLEEWLFCLLRDMETMTHASVQRRSPIPIPIVSSTGLLVFYHCFSGKLPLFVATSWRVPTGELFGDAARVSAQFAPC